VEIVNKITMKTIEAQPEPRSITEKRDIAHVFGTATGYRSGSTNYGVFCKFEGNFEAVNLETGEIYKSRNLLLPEIIESLLMEQLVSLGAKAGKMKTQDDPGSPGTPSSEPVDFAFCVGVKPIFEKDGKTIVERGQGYEYTVKPIMESKVSDSLAHIREVSDKARKALPAPGKTAQETAASPQGGHKAAQGRK
jgi:hypothetical protein